MKKPNAAELIREMLGCYNIMLHKEPAPPKRKKVSYGALLMASFARRNLTPARQRRHAEYIAAH